MTQEALDTFEVLQQWDGTVTEIADNEFTAELRDLTDPSNCREEATFDIADVSAADQPLLVLGAVFRWRIGCCVSAGGTVTVSQLRFIRSPAWRRSDVEDIRRRARRLRARFPLTSG